MPISSRYNIYGQFVGDALSRARYHARWAKWARSYALGVGVGASRLAGGLGLAATGAYYGYKAYQRYKDKMVVRRKRVTRPRRVRRKRMAGRKRKAVPMARPMKRSKVVRRRSVGPTRSSKGQQITFSRMRVGRKRIISMQQLRKMSLSKLIFAFQGVNRLNTLTSDTGYPGYFPLKWVNSATDGTPSEMPIHIYNLTNLPVNGDYSDMAFRLMLSNNLGDLQDDQFYWSTDSMAGQMPNLIGQIPATDQTTKFWQREQFDDMDNMSANNRFARTAWYDIRLNLYGAKNQPTIYDIMIVSFKDAYFDPLANLNQGNIGAVSAQPLFRSLARPMITNPILPGRSESWRHMRIYKRWRYVIQPSENSDLDTNPESRVVRLFYNDGRVLDYKHRLVTLGANEETLQGVRPYHDGTTEVRNMDPYYLARRYLIIRASNTTVSTNRTNTPSYDIVLRKRVDYVI